MVDINQEWQNHLNEVAEGERTGNQALIDHGNRMLDYMRSRGQMPAGLQSGGDLTSFMGPNGEMIYGDMFNAPKPSKQQVSAWNWLEQLMKKKFPKIPALKLPGATGYEKAGLDVLGDYVSGQSFDDFLGGPVPTALKEEARVMKAEGVGDLRRRANQTGNLHATPTYRAEADLTGSIDRGVLSNLSGIYADLNDPRGRISAAMGYGGREREIEGTNRMNAYNARLQQILAPYTYQAQVASLISGGAYLPQDNRNWMIMPKPAEEGNSGAWGFGGDLVKSLAYLFRDS